MQTIESQMLSPPQVAARWGVKADKVIALIGKGELKAVNVALNAAGRPRWKIFVDEVRRFEDARSNRAPVPKPQRRRRREVAVGREYF